jgi:hypothetical protein
MGVHGGVPLHELAPGQWLSPAGQKGKVGEVVGGEPKTLLCCLGRKLRAPPPPLRCWGEQVGRRCARRQTPPARCRRS